MIESTGTFLSNVWHFGEQNCNESSSSSTDPISIFWKFCIFRINLCWFWLNFSYWDTDFGKNLFLRPPFQAKKISSRDPLLKTWVAHTKYIFQYPPPLSTSRINISSSIPYSGNSNPLCLFTDLGYTALYIGILLNETTLYTCNTAICIFLLGYFANRKYSASKTAYGWGPPKICFMIYSFIPGKNPGSNHYVQIHVIYLSIHWYQIPNKTNENWWSQLQRRG